MTQLPFEFHPGLLLTHRDFLHALARRLVDEHRAEDLVQDAYVKALQTEPDSVRSPRAWLAQVVRNLARKARGREAERPEREGHAAGRDSVGEVGRGSREFELLHQVVSALRGLPQPYQTAIYLRYYEDLGPREIAGKLGIPLETLKSRLRRGLSLLRTDLDERHGGDRRSWCVLLATQLDAVPTAAVGAGLVANVVLPGVLTVKATAFVCTVLALAAAVFLVLRSPDPESEALTATNPVAEIVTASPGEDVAEPGRTGTGRTELPVPTGTSRAAAADPEIQLTLRVVDSAGAPVAGARVGILPSFTASTDGGGAAAFSSAREMSGERVLGIQAEGFLAFRRRVLLQPGVPDLGTFTLIRGGRIAGRVEGPSGAGVANMVVTATGPGDVFLSRVADSILRSQGIARVTAQTNGFGEFVLEPVHPGPVRVWAGTGGDLAGASEIVQVRAGEERDGVVIRLESSPGANEIAGIVVLPEGVTGAGLQVWSRHQSPAGGGVTQTTPVGDNGLFRISLRRSVPHDVWVSEDLQNWDDRRHVWTGARVLDGYRGTIAGGVPPGTRDLVLSFEKAPSFEVQVIGPDGGAISPFELGVIEFDGENSRVEIPWFRMAETGARVHVPSVGFYIAVLADGYDESVLGPWEPGTAPDPLRVELSPLPAVRGRILGGGNPIAGAGVEFFQKVSNQRIVSNGFPLRMNAVPAAVGVTDRAGDFALTLRRSGSFYLRATAPGWAPAEFGPVELDHQAGAEGLELQLSQGGAIEGSVLLPPDMNPEGWIVGVSRGDPYGQTAVIGADGAFRFDSLTPGDWLVMRLSRPDGTTTIGSGSPAPWTGNCVVGEGETTRFNLDLRSGGFSVLKGRITVVGGSFAGMIATLRQGGMESAFGGETVDRVPVGPDGSFTMAVTRAGTYTLMLRGGEQQDGALSLVHVFDFQGGVHRWEERVELGTLEGQLDPSRLAPGTRPVHVTVDSAGNTTLVPLITDETGILRPVKVPAGAGKIQVLRIPPSTGDTEQWPVLFEVTVTPGQTLKIAPRRR